MSTDQRRFRRLFLEAKERRVRALQRELNRIMREINALPVVKLDKPVRKGWKKFFVLKTAENDKRKDLAARALELINTTVYCSDKTFMKVERRNGMRLKLPIEHKLKKLRKHEWLKLPEDLAECFRETTEKTYRGEIIVYEFRWPKMFVTKVQKNFVTEARMIDPDLISRKEEVMQSLYGPDWKIAVVTRNTRRYQDRRKDRGPSIGEFE